MSCLVLELANLGDLGTKALHLNWDQEIVPENRQFHVTAQELQVLSYYLHGEACSSCSDPLKQWTWYHIELYWILQIIGLRLPSTIKINKKQASSLPHHLCTVCSPRVAQLITRSRIRRVYRRVICILRHLTFASVSWWVVSLCLFVSKGGKDYQKLRAMNRYIRDEDKITILIQILFTCAMLILHICIMYDIYLFHKLLKGWASWLWKRLVLPDSILCWACSAYWSSLWIPLLDMISLTPLNKLTLSPTLLIPSRSFQLEILRKARAHWLSRRKIACNFDWAVDPYNAKADQTKTFSIFVSWFLCEATVFLLEFSFWLCDLPQEQWENMRKRSVLIIMPCEHQFPCAPFSHWTAQGKLRLPALKDWKFFLHVSREGVGAWRLKRVDLGQNKH